MIFSRIQATGSYLPEKILTNHDLEKTIETSHDWIVERTGIEARHIASDDETSASFAIKAAKNAIDNGKMDAKDIDMIIVATATPEKIFPANACLVQQALGIPPGPAFDIQAACSGFIYAMSIADQFIKTGMNRRVLVIGTEVMSRIVDWSDRRTCILFGDGAGAVILEASDTPGLLSTFISADGRHQDLLYLNNKPGSNIQMQGNSVFKLAVNALGDMALQTLKKHDLSVDDIHWLVPHQANSRIIEATAEKLGMPMERVILTLKTQGNTSAASIPLALDAAITDGRIKRGQYLLMEAFGGGLTWGTALVKY